MISDHFPIETSIAFDYIITVKSLSKKFNYKKANWHLFREVLNVPRHFLVASTIDEQNEIITKKILSAAQKSIPFQSQKVFKSSLPPLIVDLIKEHGEKPPIKLKGEAACGPDLIHNLISFQS
ncbi:hypothetical protein BpHYR1_042168 [Brachionus plicatilis]|uniref:RNA-directed DNA polymerase from mobile element jockey-like n=1 Tax=Brachionus plicatilis TaxID=10195 RepID=A0A3M7SFH1_BRAPC|nr:hypothetical protein BpHYR1_042168 [Brachionus plicatilis]